MTEIQTRLLRNGGPAVLFEKPVMPDGSISPIPALANLFGTVKRVAMGVTLDKKSRTTAAELREVGELLAFLQQPDAAARPVATPWRCCRWRRPSCRCGPRS